MKRGLLVMKPSSTKQIYLGFMGAYSFDLILLLAMVLEKTGKKVLVVDRCDQHRLHYMLSPLKAESGSANGIYHKGNITFITTAPTITDGDTYDVVITNYGVALTCLSTFVESDWCFVVSDLAKHNVAMVCNQIRFITDFLESTKPYIKIYKDLIPCKIDATYLDHLYQLEDKFQVVADYSFELDDGNMQDDIENAFNQSFKFKHVSEAYQQFVKEVIEAVFSVKQAEIKKALKAVKRGK